MQAGDHLAFSGGMDTEIAASEWTRFFDSFSRQHEGWLVTVQEMPGASSRAHVEVQDLPLQGFSTDEHSRTISIAMGRTPEQHLTHTIAHPRRVFVERSYDGIDQGVRIEHQDGAATRVTFRTTMRPEEVDGLPV